ncbi:MAG: tRNA 2-thiouridine(34) synthase MnmA [Lachnospiraceae bacterium]|nr:tRNA 2-thiouridine(34) synthase MnmA [Lachnospiraceae bacterium]
MKALIAMSGGVDSSVAAALMKEKGYECMGVTMRLFHSEQQRLDPKSCCSVRDVDDAARVALSLSIPYETKNYSLDFSEKVINKFIRTYQCGGTPNPCIDCNRYLKFEKLLEYGLSRGCDVIVTGHYARVGKDETSGRYILKKALDPAKDQSYVLFNLTQEQLKYCRFPLGELNKAQARQIATQYGFVNANKAESQDICFVPDGDYASFIEEQTKTKYPEGDFVDTEGNVLGRHKGIIHYTIGQRKGLGLAAESPWYVTRIDVADNRVVLSHGEGLFTDSLTAHDINLISVDHIEGQMRVKAKVRYRQVETPAIVTQPDEDTLKLVFDEPQRAVTKGQAVVIYDGDTVVGGGTIA